MPVNDVISQAQTSFQKAFAHLEESYRSLQIGRANSHLVENIDVVAYGTIQPLKSVAGISVPDAQTIQIQPWDKGILAAVEKSIRESNLNLNPINDGNVVRIMIPPLTEERRRDLTKLVNAAAEEGRVAVRNARHHAQSRFRDMEKSKEISEDEFHLAEKQLQQKVDELNEKIEALAKKKEEDIMAM